MRRGKAGAYDLHRAKMAAKSAAVSRAGRDIADGFPAPKDLVRKAACRASFELYCRTYLPHTFYMPWSVAHRRAITLIEQVVTVGGLFAYAMARGSGKTSLAEAAVLWATTYGFRLFPVLIGSDEGSALELLTSIKSEVENNDLLLEDFPEVCYPVRCLERIAHRAKGQRYKGRPTHIVWTADEVVLPTIPGSIASGAIIKVSGITGRIRGMKFKRSDGTSIRPDLVIPDDPQTDESARSPSQCAYREEIINGALLGLAGPGKKIAALMPCTVIAPDDLADRHLSRELHPEWQGERSKMLVSAPTNIGLWETYAKVRSDSLRAGNGGREATAFYAANREAMDAGAEASWPARHHPDEVSAVQHAMNLKLDNPRAFAAEYQNEPQREAANTELLTVEQITAKVNGKDRGLVPAEATRLTAFIDVQQDVLFWMVCGFEDDFTGYVIDYGTFPDQKRDHFRANDVRRTLKSELKCKGAEEALRLGLERLTTQLLAREWNKEDGSTAKIERLPIDSGWATDVVLKFCRETAHNGIVIASRGVGIGAKSRDFNDFKPKRGERRGTHWRTALTPPPVQRRLTADTNFWKTFVHERLAVGIGGRGCLSLFGDDPTAHRLLAEHFTSEDPVKVEAKGQTVVEWTQRPSKPDNHWLDCIVGAHAAASERGASLAQLTPARPQVRRRVKFSEMQSKARAGAPRSN